MVRTMFAAFALMMGLAFASPVMAQDGCGGCCEKKESCCGEKKDECCDKEGCCEKKECKECDTCDAGEVYVVKFDHAKCGKCRAAVKAELEKLDGVAKVGYCTKSKAMMVTLKKDATAPSKESVESAVTTAGEDFKLTTYEKFEVASTTTAEKVAKS